jgi:hypothetical protein
MVGDYGNILTLDISNAAILSTCLSVTVSLYGRCINLGPYSIARCSKSIPFVVLCSDTLLRCNSMYFRVSKLWWGRLCTWDKQNIYNLVNSCLPHCKPLLYVEKDAGNGTHSVTYYRNLLLKYTQFENYAVLCVYLSTAKMCSTW